MRIHAGSALLCAAALFSTGLYAEDYEYYEGLGDYRLVSTIETGEQQPACMSLGEKAVYASSGEYSKFNEGDRLSVFLKNARFSYIPDNYPFSTISKGKGQVAIVVNVTQSPEEIAAPGRAAIPGRVVFYSPDLHQGQTINQSFGPVYGPKIYQNGVLNLDMTVLELDHDASDRMVPELLRTVAALGTSQLASASPLAQQALNAIGAVVVAGAKSKDDIMAKYRLTLLQEYPVSKKVAVPVLQEGDLIVVRKTQRDKPVNWHELAYCPATGTLTDKEGKVPGVGYVIFSIVKGVQGDDQNKSFLQVAGLLEEIEKRQDAGLITRVRESLQKIEVSSIENKVFSEANADLNALGDEKTRYREFPAMKLAGTVQLSLLHALDATKFETLKTDRQCASQSEHFNHVIGTTYLETLTFDIGKLALTTPISKEALKTDTLLGGLAKLDCAGLAQRREALAKLLAGPLKPEYGSAK